MALDPPEVNAVDLSKLVTNGSDNRPMDSNMLLLIGLSLVMGLALNAMRFMRLVRFLTGADRKAKLRKDYPDAHLSFDERVAERLRELDRGRQ